ncbi:MAG: 4Fe-4S dicluster domain-containing protein [Treponema sp.]|nr:4Fe-4S dicluster domain-containing protein [Treponema sp.]
MVLYFSATGNTEFAAKELARLTDDTSLNLLEKIRAGDYSEIYSEKPFIICAPIYVCEMPNFMTSFLKKVSLKGSREVYFLFTSGGYSGIASGLAKGLCRKKGLIYRGSADIVMPRNYIASDAYPMQDAETTRQKIAEGKKRVEEAAAVIKEGGELKGRHLFLFEYLIILPVTPFWIKFKLTARDFYVKDSCIGCGKCSRLCPLNNITMEDKKPVWGKACTHCMACISNCPKDSIEYGKITLGKERYLFKKWSE